MAFQLAVAQRGINSQFESLILDAAQRYGLEVALLKGIISQESSWDPNARHVDNPSDPEAVSYGLMQLVHKYFRNPDGTPITAPARNIEVGSQVIAEQLRKRSGNYALSIAGYNAGTSRSDTDLSVRIRENTNGVGDHVTSVLTYYDWFRKNDMGDGTIVVDVTDTYEPVMDTNLKTGLIVAGFLLLFGLALALASQDDDR